jgi:hypothetical protein
VLRGAEERRANLSDEVRQVQDRMRAEYQKMVNEAAESVAPVAPEGAGK